MQNTKLDGFKAAYIYRRPRWPWSKAPDRPQYLLFCATQWRDFGLSGGRGGGGPVFIVAERYTNGLHVRFGRYGEFGEKRWEWRPVDIPDLTELFLQLHEVASKNAEAQQLLANHFPKIAY